MQPSDADKKGAEAEEVLSEVISKLEIEEKGGREGDKSQISGQHKLQRKWSIWYVTKGKNQDADHYEENLHMVGTFDTIEGFWSYYSYLTRPTSLPKDFDYYVFSGTTKPMWENYPKGSSYHVKVKRTSSELDRMWEEVVLSLIGETFEDPFIIGAALGVRQKEDCFSVWNQDCYIGADRARVVNHFLKILSVDNESHHVEHKAFQNYVEHFSGGSHRKKSQRGRRKKSTESQEVVSTS